MLHSYLEGFRKANPDMGASNSRETSMTTGGENVRIKYAAASMQGFGAEMEDAVSNLLVLRKIIGRILLKYLIDFLVAGCEILIIQFTLLFCSMQFSQI